MRRVGADNVRLQALFKLVLNGGKEFLICGDSLVILFEQPLKLMAITSVQFEIVIQRAAFEIQIRF